LRLKKIEIFGFKSFADKTVLAFSKGITGIVGPNGCGKSNIADAFRWVLGEQSAKSMRGSKMPDVIFGGTTHRQPLNIAEVTITISDVGKDLPIEYEEVAVTRRLHRNGESEYFINRHPVRLKDVHELFLDSGMGKHAFSIFEQGKIDQIIQYTPLERRYIFEEAAGILRFLQRKREALRKLEQTDLNTARVKDIHLEVEKQIAVLEEQAAKARIYKENRAGLELLEKALFIAKWDNLQKRSEDLAKKDETQRKRQTAGTENIAAVNAQLYEAKNRLETSENALRAKNEEVFQVRSEKEIKTREKQAQQERLKEIHQKKKRWEEELAALAEKQERRQTERQTLQKQQTALEHSAADHERQLKMQRERSHSLEENSTILRDQQRNRQQESIKLLQEENLLESDLKQVHVRQETLQERCQSIQERKEKLVKQRDEHAERLQQKKGDMESVSKSVDDQKTVFAALEHSLKKLFNEIQISKRNHDAAHGEITEAKARQKMLLRLREENEGFSGGNKRLLQESSNAKSPLFKLLRGLYEFITPQTGFETALAALLRPYAQTLVVETCEQLHQVIAFAEKQQLKDFSLLCLESLPQCPKIESTAGDAALVQASDHPLARHFLQNIYLTDTLAAASQALRERPGIAALTKQGLFLDPQGVFFYSTPGESNAFIREAELKNLEKKLLTLEKNRQHLEKELQRLQRAYDDSMTEKGVLDKGIRRDEMKLVEVNFGLQRLISDLEKIHVEEKQLETDFRHASEGLKDISAKLSNLTQRHADAKAKGAQIHQICAQLNAECDAQTATLKQERQALQNLETAYRQASDEHKKLLHHLHILEIRDSESQEQERRLKEEIQLSVESLSQIKRKDGEAELHLQEVESALEAVATGQATLELEMTKRKNAIEALENKLQAARSGSAQIEEELYRIEIQIAQLQSATQSLVEELQERFHLTIEQARKTLDSADKSLHGIEQLEKRIRAMRQEIEGAGDINMTSIEEFDKHKARYAFLNQQLADLDVSKTELVQIIAQLDAESRKVFKTTFEVICNNFKKNFKILFNGGEADLQFTEASDVLEAGIEIIAQPPGKQMRSINLLSGGEKCMTAMALLFAIFEVKPAPFCILDEIDAPLDDSNVERFANVVKQFIDRCQFIIITHNKRTMAIADVLCGVSMQEKGVSKLLSIEFSNQPQGVGGSLVHAH